MSGRDLVRGLRNEPVPPPTQSGGGILDFLLGAVAILAVASFGYVGFATLLAPKTLTVAATTSAPTPPATPTAPTLVDADYAWTDADTSRCQAEGRAAAEAPVPTDVILAQRSVTEGFVALATRVECQITSKIKRFCDPTGKARLVAIVHDYLDRMDLVTVGMGMQGAPMAILGEAFGGEIAAGSAVYDLEKEGTFAVMRVHHKRVADGIRTLAREGIVTPSDFGSFLGMGVPSAIKEMLAGVEAERNVCAGNA